MPVSLPDLPAALRSPRRGARWPQSIEERIEITDIEWNGNPCWRWLGTHRKSDGRPTLNNKYVYRVLYEELRGPLPRGKGHASHHGCEHKWCINPWHDDVMPQGAHLRLHGLPGDHCCRKRRTARPDILTMRHTPTGGRASGNAGPAFANVAALPITAI